MPDSSHDVIVVGARCAGATLATYLARAGSRVLLLDRDPLPSDMVLSTHGISPPGMDVLDDIGVGDAVRSRAHEGKILRMNVEGEMVDLTFSPGKAEYCPRRERLDGLLQQAAVGAGAELHDRTRVTGLIREDGRVTGVEAQQIGRQVAWRAPLVVGADGRHSTIARLAGAEEYLTYEARRAGYWGYFPAPGFWRTDPAYDFDFYFSSVGGLTGVIFPTDDNQLIIGAWPDMRDADVWRADPEGMLRASLADEPFIGPLLRDATAVGKVRGALSEHYFFRTAAGPGWVLVGDAGHHKDFVIGDGITEALIQARSLARAIDRTPVDAALRRWWRQRDVDAWPFYFAGQEAGAPGPLPVVSRLVLTHMGRNPALMTRLRDMIESRASPLDIAPPSEILRWALKLSLQLRPRMIGELLAAARRAAGAYRELRRRRRLLAEVSGSS